MVFIVAASLVAMVTFVQTRSFGGLVSKVISDITERRLETKVSMRNLRISLFPPGVEVFKVGFEKSFGDGKHVAVELGRIGFYLNLIEIEERKLSFGEVRVSDSHVSYTYVPKDEEELKEIDPKIIDEAFNYSRRLPMRVDSVVVENTRIRANHDLLDIRRLKLFKQSKSFVARFHVSNIKPSAEKDYVLDEVWADAEIGKNDIDLHRLKVQHDVHSLIVKGKIQNYPKLKNASAQLGGEGLFHLKALQGLEVLKPALIESGQAQTTFQLSLLKGKLGGEANVELKDFRSNVIYADTLSAKLGLQDGEVLLENANLVYENQKASVKGPVIVADINARTYLRDPLRGEVENLAFSNVLRILGPSLKPLHGRLSGKLTFRYDKKNLYFLPEDGFHARGVALIVGDESKPFEILRLKDARIKNGEFAVVGGQFQMDALVLLPNSEVDVTGHVNKSGTGFTIRGPKVDLADFGDIAKIGLKGAGQLDLDIKGPLDDVNFDIRGKMKNFGVLGYQLGDSDLELGLGLKEGSVTIRRMESVLGKTHLSGNGAINYKNLDLALGINATSANYHDISIIMKPIVSKLTFMPADFDLNGKIDAYIHGKTKLDKLKVRSHVEFTDLVAYGESVNSGAFNILFQNETVSIENFEGNKAKGSIDGNFSFHMPTDKLALKFNWDNLSLSSFNLTKKLGLNFDGYLVGSLKGDGKVKDYVLDLKTELTDTRSGNYKYKDSSLDMKIMPDHLVGEANLLGTLISSAFNYSLKSDRKSEVKLDVNIDDVKPLAVAFLGQHLEQEDFSGVLKLNLDTSFRENFSHLDLRAQLEQFSFAHETFRVDYRSRAPEFVVVDSRLESWNLNLRETDLYVTTHGSGTFGKEVTLVNEFRMNSKIIELLIAQVLSAEGLLNNTIRIDGRGNDYIMTASSTTDKLNLSIEGAPFPFNDMKYVMNYSGSRLTIKELTTHLESGTATIRGDLFFSGKTPDVNIKYQLERAEIPILSKSSMNVTGEGIILGNQLPYNLAGEITVNKGQVVNELSDFESKSVAQVRYLPKNQESILGKLFSLNLSVKAENPIRITNSLMDVALKGEVRLIGSPVRPRGEGRIHAPANTSRIFFKNNEYFITQADINFSPKKDIANPDFDIQAITFISTYKINAKAYGDLERFNFDLTSDPALPRQSILSLIAFGYTDEIQAQLTQNQQQNLTNVGVGSFVFDRFKISDILNKQFGLQVNLGTVFEQSQTQSMLSGRSQDGQGQLGRTRSATQIELKKRLSEAMTLSVSSTMGGSIGQRQSMNLTYSLNRKVQLEGVYQLKTNAEGEEDIIDNSIGGDLKFRWTFK